MLASLCAFTLNVIEVGNEVWTELFKVIPDAADDNKRGATTKGMMASRVSSTLIKILVTCNLRSLICFLAGWSLLHRWRQNYPLPYHIT